MYLDPSRLWMLCLSGPLILEGQTLQWAQNRGMHDHSRREEDARAQQTARSRAYDMMVTFPMG